MDDFEQCRRRRRRLTLQGRSLRRQTCDVACPARIRSSHDRERHRLRQTTPVARHEHQERWRCRATRARSFRKRLVRVGVFAERAPSDLHRFDMLGIVWAELDPALSLLNNIKLVAFRELQTRKQVLRKDQSEGIADLLDLKEVPFDLILAQSFVHGAISMLYKTYNIYWLLVQHLYYMTLMFFFN